MGRSPVGTIFVILDYCGGARTDSLSGRIAELNPGATVFVLDNASPRDAPSTATHRNKVHSHFGGGIRDCVSLAAAAGASCLFFCTGDVEVVDPLRIVDFEEIALADPAVAMVSCSLSPDSCQAPACPWMVRRSGNRVRQVHLCDLSCCLLRLDFIRSFGGLPPSHGGWGFACEIAYQARAQDKKILVVDSCSVRQWRWRADPELALDSGEIIDKQRERIAVYSGRYGDWQIPARGISEQVQAEDLSASLVSLCRRRY